MCLLHQYGTGPAVTGHHTEWTSIETANFVTNGNCDHASALGDHLVVPQRRDAGVDRQLSVRGVEGLRVADTSIMPKITSGNTNAPAIAIGERVDELITEH
nr:GMC oxidoreductase [Halalkalirubrum salinum]